MQMRILQSTDRELVMAYGMKLLSATNSDPMELEMASWTAPWRAESLDHYLKLGWSFAATSENQNQILGVVLAQPFLFFKGQTQTVWIEYLAGESAEIKKALFETVYRWSRDKHIQKLIIGGESQIDQLGMPWPIQRKDGDFQVATTRSLE